jgi:hypothetical protein
MKEPKACGKQVSRGRAQAGKIMLHRACRTLPPEEQSSERTNGGGRAPDESASPFICLPERKQTRHIVEKHRVLLVGE